MEARLEGLKQYPQIPIERGSYIGILGWHFHPSTLVSTLENQWYPRSFFLLQVFSLWLILANIILTSYLIENCSL